MNATLTAAPLLSSNMLAQGTKTLGATIDVEHSHVRFLGNMVLVSGVSIRSGIP